MKSKRISDAFGLRSIKEYRDDYNNKIKGNQQHLFLLIIFISMIMLLSTLTLSCAKFSLSSETSTPVAGKFARTLYVVFRLVFGFDFHQLSFASFDSNVLHYNGDNVCRIQRNDNHFPPISQKAFAVATQNSLPRAYHIGIESFLKNNPNTTLFIYGNVKTIDPRFAKNGYRVVLVSLNLTDIQTQLVKTLPELDQALFQTETWKSQILPNILQSPMILSDFMRLSLLFLYGGSWLDADAIYLRPFTMRNGLPCHDKITSGRGYFWIQCNEDDTVHMPFNDSLMVIPGQSHYCTNGIMGQFEQRHPFLRKALLQMATLYPDLDFNPGLRTVAIGGHLFVSTMITTTLSNDKSDNRLRVSEWPLLYNITQMFGFWKVDPFMESHSYNVTSMIDELHQRNVFSVQLYHWVYEDPESIRNYFQPGKLHYELWQRNCVFSCYESVG